MELFITESFIQQKCGDAAYKRGLAYYRADKVAIENYKAISPILEATVRGETTPFHIKLESSAPNEMKAVCTCPKLVSIHTYCQHIAAVLLGLRDLQLRDSQPANDMLGLFNRKGVRPSANQLHFETRQTLHVEFICKPIELKSGQVILGMQAKIGPSLLYTVHNLRELLNHIKWREPYSISTQFTYDPEQHSFHKDTDAVIRQLINIHHNEQIYFETANSPAPSSDGLEDASLILVPPSSWEELFPLLVSAPLIKIEHDGSLFNGIQFANEHASLPLEFEFGEAHQGDYQLDVKGLQQITVFEAYNHVLFSDKMMKLQVDDCKRLADLKKMLNQIETNRIQISSLQMEHFVETVIPGLMRLGHVRIAQAVSKRLGKTGFKAKLFLDRVKDRLLAGLEFHYGHLIINPIEGHEQAGGLSTSLVREGDIEREIIQLMEDSRFVQTESGYYMHDEEMEYNFLVHTLPRLEKLVEIYATTAVKLRLHTGYRGPMIKVELAERTDWLIFKLDIQGIPETEIKAILSSLEEKRKYYKLANGSLLSLESKEFQRFNKFMNDAGMCAKELDDTEIRIPMSRAIGHADFLLDESLVSMGQSLSDLMENLQHPNQLEFNLPDRLSSVLRDYQKFGFQWMKLLAKYKFGGILADDMGLGKTLQSIAYIVSVLTEIREHNRPVIIITPSSLVYNWLNEFKKFAPEVSALIVDGSKSERHSKLLNGSTVDVIITSYPLLRRDIKMYAMHSFHTMFMDEAQAFKNYYTQTARAVKKLQADHRFALTGTPIENSIDEIWSIFNVVFPNLFPGRKDFNELTRENIAKRIRPFLLRRMKEEVLEELPEKIVSIQSSELLPAQKKLYAAYLAKLKQETLKHLNKDTFQQNKIRFLAGLTRLRQLCCHPALFVEGYKGGSAKFDQLMEIIEECQMSGKRVLIFSQFTTMLGIIGRQLSDQGLSYFYLDGQTPSSERVTLCNRFNEGEQNVFLISLKAGGTGLNLTGADTVVLYDLWWNPAVEEQAADRAHRMGQKNVVHVIKLVAQGTIEDKMNELQEKKKNLIGEIIQPGKEQLSALTEGEIREILSI